MRRSGSKFHLNHFSVITHAPKPGTVCAMGMKEVTWISLGFVVTNCTIILCWSKPNIHLVVPVGVYGINCVWHSCEIFCCVYFIQWQELLHPPPRQTYSMDMEYSFVWKPTEMGSPRDGWTRDEELDVTDKGMPKVMPGCSVTGIFWQEVTGRILPME